MRVLKRRAIETVCSKRSRLTEFAPTFDLKDTVMITFPYLSFYLPSVVGR
jgi:hypothetical protein